LISEDLDGEKKRVDADLNQELQDLGKIPKRRGSHLRQRVSEALEKAGPRRSRIALIDLDNENIYPFDSYHEAIEFMSKHKGRWYVSMNSFQNL
jgi:hypothetical protein